MITEFSRYRLAELIRTDDNYIRTSLRRRLEFSAGEDDIPHAVVVGDTLRSLAAQYFTEEFGGSDLWWAIADYQPDVINDPTIVLNGGDIIVIPSPVFIQDVILGIIEDDEQELA